MLRDWKELDVTGVKPKELGATGVVWLTPLLGMVKSRESPSSHAERPGKMKGQREQIRTKREMREEVG